MHTKTTFSHLRRIRILAGVVLALGCFAAGSGYSARDKGTVKTPERRPVNVDELKIVDCLLPGQVRKLGRSSTFITPRRPIRTTALDCSIRGGEQVVYDRADYKAALAVWLEAAEGGDPQAQYYVGEIYESGLGIEPDYDLAAQWYRRAAEQDHRPAQVNLGYLHEQGLGVERDQQLALEWYRKASGVEGVILTENELAELRGEIADRDARLEEAEQSAGQTRAELDDTQRQLELARTSAEDTAELKAKVSALTKSVNEREKDVENLRATLTRYDLPGPSIQILNTSLYRSAGAPPPAAELVGRVEAPAGLRSFTVNGARTSVADDGFFEVQVREERTFELIAVDRLGKRAQIEHELGKAPQSTQVDPAAVDPGKVKFGSYHALVIGNASYEEFPSLQTAVADAEGVAELLAGRYGFNTTLLRDASYAEILTAFHDLIQLGDADNLLIYFAGHGELDQASDIGYWLPVDAKRGTKTNWLSSRQVAERLSAIPAKHVLVVADSCYSGWLTTSSLPRFEGGTQKDRRRWFREVSDRRSRIGLTSGGLRPVLDAGDGDHSIFARALMDALEDNSDILDTRSLWTTVKSQVEFRTRRLDQTQVPEHAPIQRAGHESGEFFFVPISG